MLFVAIATLGALIPTTLYVLFIWWLDRYEKEPFRLLALAFVWGAVPAAIISVLLELLLDIPIVAVGGQGLVGDLASVSISAPLVEESAKGIALIGLVLSFLREFDDVLDGIIYGAMIGFGFAFTENLAAYYLPILRAEGLQAGMSNILLRSIVFGFNHAFWTGITGAAVGYARLSSDRRRRILVPVGGWMLAVAFHSVHNAGVTLAEQTSMVSLGVSLAVDWGGVLLLLLVAFFVLRKERHWIEQGLAEEVHSGILTHEEWELLRSAGQRLWVRWHALERGGAPAYRSVGHYYQCATELAFKKHHLRTLGDERGNLAEVQRLRQILSDSRAMAWPWLWPDGT